MASIYPVDWDNVASITGYISVVVVKWIDPDDFIHVEIKWLRRVHSTRDAASSYAVSVATTWERRYG